MKSVPSTSMTEKMERFSLFVSLVMFINVKNHIYKIDCQARNLLDRDFA